MSIAGYVPRLTDYAPPQENVLAQVVGGLRREQKRLPCKLFYDQRGSRLFDQICELPEYYPTRTELSIMRRHGDEIAHLLGPRALLVEYGSGSSLKTRVLLESLRSPAGYVPIDISREHLWEASKRLAASYPHVPILPVCADYTAPYRLPKSPRRSRSTVVYFPGSTIGNFTPREAVRFLRRIRRRAGPGSGLLIGVDLKKDPAILHAAYNDRAGVTAAFNLNLLMRLNRELGANFVVDRFAHYAPYNLRAGRIEMHLVSTGPQRVTVGGETFDFREGETIFTECSHKYTFDDFETLAAEAGYRIEQLWTDDRRLFSVQYLIAEA